MISNQIRHARLQRMMSTKAASLEYMWMPFTNNRQFKGTPRLVDRCEGMYYFKPDGTKVLDACAGLWCANAGHRHPKIIEAIKKQLDKMDYAPSFNFGHPLGFKLAEMIRDLMPNSGMDYTFFTLCGSSAVDTSMKIALAYFRAKGEASRTRFIGREKGYHGVGFGGISVGGIVPNRKAFHGALLPNIDHLPHTHSHANMAFSKGQPAWGAHLADDLERIVALHDASNIAAVILEPVSGSAGVIVPPVGYLEKIRSICDKHGILLILDEVITGFGRLGAPFASQRFNVPADMITMAKGLTNASIPAGAVLCNKGIYETMMAAADASGPNSMIELFHGYTYSAHPVAMAAGVATLEVYKEEGLFERAKEIEGYFEAGLHSLKGGRNVIDIRNMGLMGAVELQPLAGKPGARGFAALRTLFEEKNIMVRATGDSIAFSPPLIVDKKQIDEIVEKVGSVINNLSV